MMETLDEKTLGLALEVHMETLDVMTLGLALEVHMETLDVMTLGLALEVHMMETCDVKTLDLVFYLLLYPPCMSSPRVETNLVVGDHQGCLHADN